MPITPDDLTLALILIDLHGADSPRDLASWTEGPKGGASLAELRLRHERVNHRRLAALIAYVEGRGWVATEDGNLKLTERDRNEVADLPEEWR